MPPPRPPADVYPCLDWIPQGKARSKPERLKLSRDELRTVIARTKQRALEARRRLGQSVQNEVDQTVPTLEVLDGVVRETVSDSLNATKGSTNDDDDVIMKEYGLDGYDDEDGENNGHDIAADGELSEDDDGEANATRGPLRGLAEDIAGLTYHCSNDEDPYLRQGNNNDENDDDEDDAELLIKPTDNLIVAGRMCKNEPSIEVYVYDNERNEYYLHHDIIQSGYPCCVKWIGYVRNKTRNLAAAGYLTPKILIWDLDVVDVLEPIETLAGHTDAVIDICWNSQVRNIIASGSADKHVRIWNLDECKSISNIKLTGEVSTLEFGIHDHFHLLAGDLNQNVSLIDTRTSTVTNKWKLAGEVEKVRWIPNDSSKFLVSDDGGYIYYYDLRHNNKAKPIVTFRAHQNSVTGLEFSPQCPDMLVTASADDTIKVWDTKISSQTSGVEPKLIKEITDLNVGSILSLGMCPNSLAKIAVGGDSKCNSFRTYDLTCEKEVSDRFMNQS